MLEKGYMIQLKETTTLCFKGSLLQELPVIVGYKKNHTNKQTKNALLYNHLTDTYSLL